MRTIPDFDTLDDIAGRAVDDLPIRSVDGRHVNRLAVRCDGHAIAPFLVSAFPEDLFRLQVEAPQFLRRTHVKLFGESAAAETFGLRAKIGGRHPAYELVFGVDVKDKD